jgi:starch synthase (maltosyl-transferring)
VRIFRVDNPHTKPLPFWEWLIEDIRARDPDVIFLAEAFTRPTMMYRLAKVGFSESYTYFTWRNTKYELTSYFTELAKEPVSEFFRPHLFVNTPDINPFFLQTGGRPAFLIRAALACTLSGLWGMYNGFELCESRPLRGREEYIDSEKYEIRAWDWDRAGNIRAEISRLNQIRRANPALHSHRGLEFLNAFDDAVLYYAKTTPDGRNTLLVAVNLDPRRAIETELEVPLWRFGLPDEAAIGAEDLMRAQSLIFHGKRQRVRLDPSDLPFAIWRLDNPRGRRYGQAP